MKFSRLKYIIAWDFMSRLKKEEVCIWDDAVSLCAHSWKSYHTSCTQISVGFHGLSSVFCKRLDQRRSVRTLCICKVSYRYGGKDASINILSGRMSFHTSHICTTFRWSVSRSAVSKQSFQRKIFDTAHTERVLCCCVSACASAWSISGWRSFDRESMQRVYHRCEPESVFRAMSFL